MSIGTLCQATNPAIGLAVAKGNFQVDSAQVRGNATLFEGNTVETGKSSSQVQLQSGAQVRLATESRAKVFGNRSVLEKGTGQLESSGKYEIEARTLRISGTAPNTVARVQISGAKTVVVAAMAGAVRVTNARGVLVASMGPGRELAFDPQAGASAPTQLTGCLLKKDGKYIVVDATTNVTMEVRGEGVEKELGNRVEASGAATGDVITLASLKQVGKGGCSSVAAKAGASAGAAGAAGAAVAGLSTAATVAIVGGVAVAASVGGLAAAGTFSSGEPAANTSR